MAKINVKEFVPRLLPQYWDLVKLINYIYSVQRTRAARLDFGATAKVLGCDWKTVKRLCDKLARADIIHYEGDGLRLAADVMVAE